MSRIILHKTVATLLFAASLIAFGGCSGDKKESSDSLKASRTASTPDPKKSTEVVSKPAVPAGPRYHDRIRVKNLGPLREVFNDSNKYQYAHAERLGINPIHTLNDSYFSKRPLVKVSSCSDYFVDSLTHSMPYLVPEAAALLSDIGRNFIDSLASRGADGYRIKVTSLLRTPMHVRKLRRVNVNATDSSTHQFGTTFDISWRNFACEDETRTINEGDLKNLLAEVLFDLRKEGRCLVKYEHKTCCFHITTIK